MHLWKESHTAAVGAVIAWLQKYINLGVYFIIKLSVVCTVRPDVSIEKKEAQELIFGKLCMSCLFS